MHMSVSVGSC